VRCLRIIRAVFRISLSELSEESHVSVRELSRIENGEAAPGRDTLTALDAAIIKLIHTRTARA
jgi:transcriptional regulator with XRE-family HTH domain